MVQSVLDTRQGGVDCTLITGSVRQGGQTPQHTYTCTSNHIICKAIPIIAFVRFNIFRVMQSSLSGQ